MVYIVLIEIVLVLFSVRDPTKVSYANLTSGALLMRGPETEESKKLQAKIDRWRVAAKKISPLFHLYRSETWRNHELHRGNHAPKSSLKNTRRQKSEL